MPVTRISDHLVSSGLRDRRKEGIKFPRRGCLSSASFPTKIYNLKGLGSSEGLNCNLSFQDKNFLSPMVTCRNSHSWVFQNQLSYDSCVETSDLEEELTLKAQDEVSPVINSSKGTDEITKPPIRNSGPSDVKKELIMLSLPAMAGQAIDPLAQLMETAYIGRLSAVALASAGISISIFNIVSKLFNIPLLSIATSFVAEDISKNASEKLQSGEGIKSKATYGSTERKQLSSVSTALLLAVLIGIFEAVALSFGAGPFLNLMGVPVTSEMYNPAKQFLSLRALGSPAVVVSLALQGIFRGFKDTGTPVYCLGKYLFFLVLQLSSERGMWKQ